tara:strand:+ start:38145 stop:39191 length:1047 start_codon:yes stop_codon:yes gene_type:complete
MSFTTHYFKESNGVFPNSLVQDKVYHGSSTKFKEFSNKYIGGSHGTAHGMGFYFTGDEDFARAFLGKEGKVYEVYINITKPMSLTKKTISVSELKRFLKKIDPTGDDFLSAYGDVNYEGYNSVLNTAATETYKYNDNDTDILHDILNGGGFDNEEYFNAVNSHFGFDGVITKTDKEDIDVYVVFDKKNIKIINVDESVIKEEDTDKVNFGKADGDNNYYGYKVMFVDDSGKHFTPGANKKLRLPVKTGVIHKMPTYGIFMNNDPEYVVTYYSYKEDEDDPDEYVIKYKFNLDDVITGREQLADREPEIGVRKALVYDMIPIDDWNDGKRFSMDEQIHSSDMDSRQAVQ